MDQRDPTSPPTHFSVHAEFTISHPGVDNPRNRPRTSMERDETTGGVRMTYSWQPEWGSRAQSEHREAWPMSTSNSAKSIYNSDTPSSTATLTPPRSIPPKITPPSAIFDTDYTRGYQKGNMFFTSTPPPKTSDEQPSASHIPKGDVASAVGRGLIHDSSGYGSDLLSPNSQGGSLPRRVLPGFHNKCRSTCNITLATANPKGTPQPAQSSHSQCGRTQSLRCQTPSSYQQQNPHRFYGCGDPWCHHLGQGDPWNISPVPEETSPVRASGTETSTKKDASVQTFEMVDKCTSPFLRMNSGDSIDRSWKRYQRRGYTEPISRRNQSSAGSFTPDSLDNSVKSPAPRAIRKLRRMPAFDRTKEPIKEQSPADSKTSDSLKKPRTVHIDVYCTGTEMESNASSDSSEESKSASTPQTVFENEKMKVTHKKADSSALPFYLRRNFPSNVNVAQKTPLVKSFETNTSIEKDESDDDNASTAYPSKMSSYSNMGDFSASASSVPRSWTTYSLSSCAIPEDYDSVANTSWKDTFSDIDSLMMSRSSIAPTDSLDFVPRRRYEAAQSIDETPEFSVDGKHLLDTPSATSIQPSDSFEYANSEDRLRIRQMEEMWKNRGSSSRSSKYPMNERTMQAEQKRMQEYLDKKMRGKQWDSKDTDSNDSDDSGKAWTFIKGAPTSSTIPDSTLKSPETPASRQRSPVNPLPNTVRDAFLRYHPKEPVSASSEKPQAKTHKFEPRKLSREDQGSLSDSSSPSSVSTKQRLSLDPNLRSPFMLIPGIYTEPRSIARKFGTVVSLMKKPGHHIGPAKNPDCMCDHCQSYWQQFGRNRTRSVGDPPSGQQVRNWKEFLEEQQKQSSNPTGGSGPLPYTDL